MKKFILAIILFLIPLSAISQVFQFNSTKNSNSQQAAILYNEALNALRMRRLKISQELFLKVIEEYPDEAYAYLARRNLAEIYIDINEHEKAIEIYQQMLKSESSPDNQQYARKGILDIYFQLQRFKEAIELIESWRSEDRQDIWLEQQLARFYLQTGHKDEAWLLLETILERTSSYEVFTDLLELAIKTDEVEKLLQFLDNRRTRFRSRDYSSFASDCYIALKRFDKAIEVIRNTENIDNEWHLLQKLADLQIDKNLYEDALITLRKIEKRLRNDWQTIKKAGKCLFFLNRKDEAINEWRRHIEGPVNRRRENYINFTTVLLEHQLYEEALKGYAEGRQNLGNPTLFAEEIATVLDALGRSEEALEEYLQVFANGHFKIDIFNKLFESMKDGYDLESRLEQLFANRFNIAVRQALLELHFRLERSDSPEKIVEIVNSSRSVLDDFFFERLNQEATIFAGNFHIAVCLELLSARPDSTLAIKVASLLLDMAEIEPIFSEIAFRNASKIVKDNTIVDAEMESQLVLQLARFVFKHQQNIKKAHEYLDLILQTSLLKAAPKEAVEAAIFKAHLFICEEKYKQAKSLLDQNHQNVKKATENFFAADPIGENDYIAHILLELAFLAANQGDLQKALNTLKIIVEKYTDSVWCNDALSEALFITRTSVGDFSLHNKTRTARRLAARNETEKAVEIYDNLIKENASMTAFIKELEADKIVLLTKVKSEEESLGLIDDFIARYPEHFAGADLLELKLNIFRRQQASKDQIRELLQTFIDDFPNDLRTGRYKNLLEEEKYLLEMPEN